MGHAEKLAPAFQALLSEAGIKAQDLKRIGVTVGPGSFMGQRVGLAFAKGLAMGTGAETVPLTTLEALAEAQDGPVLVLIDARRGQVYAQRFEPGEKAAAPVLLGYEDAARLLEEGVPAVGSGVAVVAPARSSQGPVVPTPEALLALAERKPVAPLKTLYLRAPDAKPPQQAPL